MKDLLDELTLSDLTGDVLELAETVGLESFKSLVLAYGGSGRLYVPTLSNVVSPIRNRHIRDDYQSGALKIHQIVSKYGLSETYVRKIIQTYTHPEK